MTEATNRPMRQTSPMNWLAGQDFDFAEFAAFLRRHDPEWLIQCATRSVHTPGTVDRDDSRSVDTSNESGSVTCDAKWESPTTKVEHEIAHDKNDMDSDAPNMPHAVRVLLTPSCQLSIDACVAGALDITIISTD